MRCSVLGRTVVARRPAETYAACLVVSLALMGCGGPGGQEAGGGEGDGPSVAEVASSGAPTDESTSTTGEPPRYETEDGIFSWTLPSGWTVSTIEKDPGWIEEMGMPAENIRFQNTARNITFRAEVGNGNRKHDRAWPHTFEVIDSEHMPNAPQPATEYQEVWYQAALVSPSDGSGSEWEMWVRVAETPGGDPLGKEGEEYATSWGYYTPAVDGYEVEALHLLHAYISQEDAERITGLEGENAVRGLLQTEEYIGLKELATSMVVEIP